MTDVIESAWHGFYISPTWSNCKFLCVVVVRCGIMNYDPFPVQVINAINQYFI